MLRCPGWSIPTHEGGERKRETAPTWRARRVDTGARRASRLAAGIGSAVVVVSAAPVPAGASGILPPSNPSVSVPPQVMPACSLSPVDDTSAGCTDSILHNINYARSLEGLGPLVLPSDYASDPVAVQQLILTDEERGDRGLSQYSGPRRHAQHRRADRGAGQRRPSPARRATSTPGRIHLRPGLHAARGRLRLDVRRRLRRHQPRLHLAGRQRLLGPPRQHPRDLDDHGGPAPR